MKSVSVILLLSLLFHGHGLSAAEQGGNRVEQFFDQLQTLEADFYQRVDGGETGVRQESTGRVWIQRPGRFRWHYQHPYEQELVADGKNLWTHDPDLEQVTVKPAAEVLTDSPAMLLSGQRPVSSVFDIQSLERESELDWFRLLPLSEDATVEEIQLGFRDEELLVMQILDHFGNRTTLHFQQILRNQGLDEGLFRFIPPANADLIGTPQ